jgi:hypothetical protein
MLCTIYIILTLHSVKHIKMVICWPNDVSNSDGGYKGSVFLIYLLFASYYTLTTTTDILCATCQLSPTPYSLGRDSRLVSPWLVLAATHSLDL